VHVLVESLPPEIEQAGLTTQQLLTDIEIRLRQAAIHVLTREEVLQAFSVIRRNFGRQTIKPLSHNDLYGVSKTKVR
jgi:hypothetical protein